MIGGDLSPENRLVLSLFFFSAAPEFMFGPPIIVFNFCNFISLDLSGGGGGGGGGCFYELDGFSSVKCAVGHYRVYNLFYRILDRDTSGLICLP